MKKKIEQIFESSFWEEVWGEAQELREVKKKKSSKSDSGRPWDKRAEHFNQKTSGKDGSARTESVIKFLEEEGAYFQGMKVVDIGCGPGSITLRLAEKADHVYALDPSEKMLELLNQKIKEQGAKNITLLQERWQDVKLEEKDWHEAFDLSFSSMSPGVDGPQDMKKLLDSSKKFCYFSTFAGRRDKSRQELWEQLLGEKFEERGLDIIYPFNFLYSWGYRPSLRFYSQRRRENIPPEEAVREILQYFHMALEVDEKVEEAVRSYIEQRLQQDGRFPYESEASYGMMLWDKNVITSR